MGYIHSKSFGILRPQGFPLCGVKVDFIVHDVPKDFSTYWHLNHVKLVGRWINPIWKICSSNVKMGIGIFPNFRGVENSQKNISVATTQKMTGWNQKKMYSQAWWVWCLRKMHTVFPDRLRTLFQRPEFVGEWNHRNFGVWHLCVILSVCTHWSFLYTLYTWYESTLYVCIVSNDPVSKDANGTACMKQWHSSIDPNSRCQHETYMRMKVDTTYVWNKLNIKKNHNKRSGLHLQYVKQKRIWVWNTGYSWRYHLF